MSEKKTEDRKIELFSKYHLLYLVKFHSRLLCNSPVHNYIWRETKDGKFRMLVNQELGIVFQCFYWRIHRLTELKYFVIFGVFFAQPCNLDFWRFFLHNHATSIISHWLAPTGFTVNRRVGNRCNSDKLYRNRC